MGDHHHHGHHGHHGGRGGGPGVWGPGGWGWGRPGPPPPPPPGHAERTCWAWFWCCFTPPPPPSMIVLDSNGNPVNQTPVVAETAPVYREIKALEYREGDTPIKYFLNVPTDVVYGSTIQVDLGGSIFSVRIPEYIQRGEKVIIIAPAPLAQATPS